MRSEAEAEKQGRVIPLIPVGRLGVRVGFLGDVMKANGAEVMAEKDNGREEKLAAKDKSWNMIIDHQRSEQTVLMFLRLFTNKIIIHPRQGFF